MVLSLERRPCSRDDDIFIITLLGNNGQYKTLYTKENGEKIKGPRTEI